MSKSSITKKLESKIWETTSKIGVFGCFEVTIGRGGKERVDFLTCDTEGIWRFYEIKSSKKDFYSNAKKTFLGHFNYYVMPKKLYDSVKDDIPGHIGVYVDGYWCIKNPKRQELGIDETTLKDSMIRSLHRDVSKLVEQSESDYLQNLKKELRATKKSLSNAERDYREIKHELSDTRRFCRKKFGRKWDKDEGEQLSVF